MATISRSALKRRTVPPSVPISSRRLKAPQISTPDLMSTPRRRALSRRRAPSSMLGIGRRRPGLLDRDLLEILAAGHRALVEHRHAGTGKAGGDRSGKARRSAANDQDLDLLLGNGVDKFRLGTGFGARQYAPEDLAADRHRPIELGHAGALARPAIDLDQAVLADPHAAEDPPRRSGSESGGNHGCRPRSAPPQGSRHIGLPAAPRQR